MRETDARAQDNDRVPPEFQGSPQRCWVLWAMRSARFGSGTKLVALLLQFSMDTARAAHRRPSPEATDGFAGKEKFGLVDSLKCREVSSRICQ